MLTGSNAPLLLGFAAFSGTGKTELLTKLIPILVAQGLRLGIVKHAHHNFDVDQPSKDSYRLRHAGAQETLISSSRRWALMHELADDEEELTLSQLLERIDTENLDIILVEGFKRENFPKIELNRPSLGHPYLHPDDANIVALASDEAPPPNFKLPHLDLNNPPEIAAFIAGLHNGTVTP